MDYIKKSTEYKLKTRNNQEIPLSKIHQEILTIMDEIDRICRKNSITYGLIAGSALGIVNYQGFIPWDDDIDIFILRSDWKKFLKALDNDLNEDFYYHCYDKDNRYNVLIPQMKIRKKNTYIEEENILLDNNCEGNGIFIDIVTYGEINENKLIDEIFRTIIKIISIPTVIIDNLGYNPNLLKKMIISIDNKYNQLSKNSNLLSQPITIPWEKFMKEPVFKKEDILPVKEYNFEGRKYFSYNNIEKILKKWYGDNCLKKYNPKNQIWEETLPEEKRNPKHIVDIKQNSDTPKNPNHKIKLKKWIRLNIILFLISSLTLIFKLYNISLIIFIILIISLCRKIN